MRRFFISVLAVMFLGVACACVASDMDAAKKASEDSARAWLTLVDEGSYAQSWESAAPYFKTAVSQENHGQALKAAREPLGEMVSRVFFMQQYMTSIPGGPDGEYMVIQYNASFKNKKSALETVTLALDKDGQWKVAGYYIK